MGATLDIELVYTFKCRNAIPHQGIVSTMTSSFLTLACQRYTSTFVATPTLKGKAPV